MQPDGMETTFRMSEIFRIGPAGLGKALDMNFFLGIQIRGAVLTAILISGAVPVVVRAEFLPGAIPNGLSAFLSLGCIRRLSLSKIHKQARNPVRAHMAELPRSIPVTRDRRQSWLTKMGC